MRGREKRKERERRGREGEGGEERREKEGEEREERIMYREGRMSERRRGCKTIREFCFIQCEYTFLSSDSDSGSAK